MSLVERSECIDAPTIKPASFRLKPIVFAGLGDGWSEYPGRQALLHVIAEQTPVIFLRWRERPDSLFSKPELREIKANIFEIRNALSFRNSRLQRLGSIVGSIDGLQLKMLLSKHGFGDFIYWLSVPEPRLLWGIPRSRIVYDCVDPCFVAEDQSKFDAAEFSVARKAKLIFCTAHSLLDRLKPVNQNAYLVPNACSRDTYDASQRDLAKPRMLEGVAGPYIGYMGTIDWRFDAATIEHAAKSLPGYTFVMVGRVNQDQEARIASLRGMPNVIFTGSVSNADGLEYTNAFDVGLIPFIPGEMNDAINPVKMYMYLVAGKPVVSTLIRECMLNPGLVATGRTAEEFAELIRVAVETETPAKREERVRFGLANRWEDRAETVLDLMRNHHLFA